MVTAGLKKILPSDLTRIDVPGHSKNTIFVPALTKKPLGRRKLDTQQQTFLQAPAQVVLIRRLIRSFKAMQD